MRVDLLLGVEGVLTPVPGAADLTVRDASRESTVEVLAASMPCRISPALIEKANFLNRLTHGFWLTSWMQHAPRSFAPASGFHGRMWPVLVDRPEDDSALADYGWWKAAAVARHLARTPAEMVVWIDDDINTWALGHEASATLLADDRLVNVCPPPTGLTPDLIDAVIDVVADASSRTGAGL